VRFAWCYRAAVIYEERAAADDEAVRAYEAALALDPGSRPALAGLARAHYRGRQLEALAGVLLKQSAAEPNPASASALAVEASRILALRLGRVEEALAATSRALSLDPANVVAIADHARLLARLGRGPELAEAMGSLGQALADPIDKAAAYRLQAEIAEWQLGGKREALAAIERAAAAMSAERHSGASAIRIALQRLYQLVGRGAEQAAAELARLSEGQRVPDVGRSLDLAWRLGDPEGAWRAVRAALDVAPGDGAVLDAAVTLATKLGRDRDRAQALERLAASSGEAATAAVLLRAAAIARERAATRPNEALPDTLPLLRRVVETHATEEALAVLERQATRAGDWQLVILARRQLAESAPDAPTRAVLLWELGGARLASGDLGGADADFARAIEADPTLLPALHAQARLREARGDSRAAAELYAREARLTKAPGRAAEGFRQAARLYANVVRDDAMAGRCLEEVLALEPEAETDFEVLDAILRAKGDNDRLAQVMRRRAAAGPVPKRRDRLLALADLIYERDPIEAASVLGEAVTLDPSSVPALIRLAEVEAEIGRSADAIATYRLAITASSDPKGVGAAWARIGDIAERALADIPQAVDAYRNALLSTPDDLPALAGLARGLVRQRDWPNAAQTLRRLSAVETEREARVGHLVTLGELLAGPAEDPEGAADAFEGALAVHPSHAVAIDRLDKLLTELEEPARLASALGRFLEMTPDARDRRMRLASLLSGPLKSGGRAVDELRIVVSGDERDVEARAELARVLEQGGVVAAVESAYMKQRLVESQSARTQAIESGEQTVVGVNQFTEAEPSPLLAGGQSFLEVDASAEREQIERLRAFRARRSQAEVTAALQNLKDVLASGGNVMPASIRAAHAGVTTGEWADALRALFGEYRAPTGVVPRRGHDVAAPVERCWSDNDEVASRRIDAYTGQDEYFKDGQSDGNATFVVSRDGRIITSTSHRLLANGRVSDVVSVLEKQ
jgi:tetratricopeptide (TPR) repeat protein